MLNSVFRMGSSAPKQNSQQPLAVAKQHAAMQEPSTNTPTRRALAPVSGNQANTMQRIKNFVTGPSASFTVASDMPQQTASAKKVCRHTCLLCPRPRPAVLGALPTPLLLLALFAPRTRLVSTRLTRRVGGAAPSVLLESWRSSQGQSTPLNSLASSLRGCTLPCSLQHLIASHPPHHILFILNTVLQSAAQPLLLLDLTNKC